MEVGYSQPGSTMSREVQLVAVVISTVKSTSAHLAATVTGTCSEFLLIRHHFIHQTF